MELLNTLRQFDCTIGTEALDVLAFTVEEKLFSDFRLDVTLVSGRQLKLADYIGKDALFTILGKKEDRYFHGFVSEFEELEPRGRHYIFRATIVPWVWKLNHIADIRIFQEKTTPEIVQEVLEGSGILSNQFELRLHGTYSPREYCVQYRETNREFISRLLAEEGIFTFFEFSKEGHLLVFGDMHVCHKAIPGNPQVIFSPPGQLVGTAEHVTEFISSEAVTTGRISYRDYHFKKPSFLPSSEAKGEQYSELERYDYPGNLTDDATGVSRASTGLERASLNTSTMRGKSVCRRFTAGHRFTLTDHGNSELNTEYLLVSVFHTGEQPQSLQELADPGKGNSYSNEFFCIRSEIPYRPELPKMKPSVMGVQTAVVTGPSGEEIYTDEFGRIKVRFHWDRSDAADDRTSCWMRVAQPWAGSGWGSVFIPRIGQEVIVNFIDGDPDKPIVTGAVYNGANKPPYALPAEKTKSTLKSNSTVGGGGFNELRFEDKKGEEEIFIHGEKDWTIEIKNDKNQHVGHDETLAVDNDRTKTVGNDQAETIGNNKDISVTKNHTESIGENMSVTIGKNLDESTGENKTISIGKNLQQTVGEDSANSIGKDSTIDVGNDQKETIGNNSVLDVGNNSNTSIGKDSTVSVGNNLTADIVRALKVEAGDVISVSSTNSSITLTAGGASVTITNSGDIVIDGVNVTISASGNLTTSGSVISKN